MDVLEQMRVKAWLSGAQAGGEVADLESSVERLRGYENLARSMGADTSGEAVTRYAEAVGNYVRELMETSTCVRTVIALVQDERQRRILSLRYISNLTWERVADEMCYCTPNVHRHANGVKPFQREFSMSGIPSAERKWKSGGESVHRKLAL